MISNIKKWAPSIAVFLITVNMMLFVLNMFVDYLDMPEVYLDDKGECLAVVNFKPGDVYTCSDKDKSLVKYHVVSISPLLINHLKKSSALNT